MNSTRIPKAVHHALKRDSPAGPLEPKGPPLSTRITLGRPKRRNNRMKVRCTGFQL
jgi:hypothetical protein